jgi:hypothetical protein
MGIGNDNGVKNKRRKQRMRGESQLDLSPSPFIRKRDTLSWSDIYSPQPFLPLQRSNAGSIHGNALSAGTIKAGPAFDI